MTVGAPIFTALVLTDALLLWLIIKTQGRWIVKLTAIIVALLFNFVVWNALGSFTGWPSGDPLPKKSVFISGIVHEPNPSVHDAGSIDIWVVPLNRSTVLLGYNPSRYTPRAYREPFSPELESAVVRAQKLQAANPGQPIEMGQTKGNGKRGGTPGRHIPRWAVRRYRLPNQLPLTKRGH